MAAGSAYHDPHDAGSIRPGAPQPGEAARDAPPIAWLAFAGWFLIIAGVMHAFWGIVALTREDYFVEGSMLWSSLSTFGWIALLIALAQLVGGGALLVRSAAGSMVAALIAALGIVFNFLAIGAYPIWSVIMIVANAVVIYAVTARGEELT